MKLNKMFFYAIVLFVLVSLGIFTWFYLFNIYETRVTVHPKYLTADLDSKIEINVIPLNSFGSRALLRNISAKFEIISGDSLVKISESTSDKITLQSLGQLGKVEILVTPEIGLFPSKIEIEIIGKK
ncbi:MAG: hypothetical protein L3J41_09280 [Melioribacteraceae bacterium]|nr:hypothetical protein [Melioribacteraceae bacterium]